MSIHIALRPWLLFHLNQLISVLPVLIHQKIIIISPLLLRMITHLVLTPGVSTAPIHVGFESRTNLSHSFQTSRNTSLLSARTPRLPHITDVFFGFALSHVWQRIDFGDETDEFGGGCFVRVRRGRGWVRSDGGLAHEVGQFL